MKKFNLWGFVFVSFVCLIVVFVMIGNDKTQITPQEATFELRRGPTSPERYGPLDDYDCGDFGTWEEAQGVFESGGVEDDVYGLDRDKDGIACEALR